MLCGAILYFSRLSIDAYRYSENLTRSKFLVLLQQIGFLMVEQVKFASYKGINVCDKEEIGCHDTVNKSEKKPFPY